MIYCHTKFQSADVFTKALAPHAWSNAMELLGMQTSPSKNQNKTKIEKEMPEAKAAPVVVALPSRGLYAATETINDVLKQCDNVMEKDTKERIFNVMAAYLAETATETVEPPLRARPTSKLPGHGKLIELCTDANSAMGRAAKEFPGIKVRRITQEHDLADSKTVESILSDICRNPGTSVHASLPCTSWCQWQVVNLRKFGEKYRAKLREQQIHSKHLLRHFITIAEVALQQGSEISFEWPDSSLGWLMPELVQFQNKWNLHSATVHSCACGLTNSKGQPMHKRWRIITSCERLAVALNMIRCDGTHRHVRAAGKETKPTQSYPLPLCRTYLSSLFATKRATFTPAMPVGRADKVLHKISHTARMDPGVAPIMVTKLLTPLEMHKNPDAIKAVQEEAQGLLKLNTWDESTVIDRDDLKRQAQEQNQEIHIGNLMSICSIKFFECPKDQWKYKGRLCFRGDNVKDQNNVAAVFQEMQANPTSIQTANANIAYGLIPGHESQTSDAPKAYCQSLLKGRAPTWVCLPKELWKPEWHGKYKRPCCLLHKALYGHPESGAHWQNWLEDAVTEAGGKPISGHPSSFWFDNEKCILTIYVDDLLISGPKGKHDIIWDKLRNSQKKIDLDPPEVLDRFLGRTHTRK
jgi:hypothetical protein